MELYIGHYICVFFCLHTFETTFTAIHIAEVLPPDSSSHDDDFLSFRILFLVASHRLPTSVFHYLRMTNIFRAIQIAMFDMWEDRHA